MTLTDSFPRLANLQEFAANWFRENANVATLAEAEETILALSRVLAETMMESAIGTMTGKKTYQGPSTRPPDEDAGEGHSR